MWVVWAWAAMAGSLVINGVTVETGDLKGERIASAEILIDDRGVVFIRRPTTRSL